MHGAPQNDPDMRAIKAAAKSQFGHVRGVQGFGIGDRALRIYVTDARVKAHLPANFRGVPVVFVVTGEISALRPK